MLERLQKIISRAGIASRRHAEELIVSGQVKVNGVVVTELGAKADPERDHIEAAGRAADQPAAASYFILHKPPHVVSTMADPEGRATLRHLLRGLAGGVFPVGGLEYASSGLILLTSDGQLANSIFKTSSNLTQVFWVKLKGRPSLETLSKVTHRARARLRLLPAPDASAGHVENPWYEAELRGLRRDLLRQAFFDAGHPVEKMKRVRLGPIELGDLPEAQYRQLTPSEVASLRRAVERAAEQGAEQVASLGKSETGIGGKSETRIVAPPFAPRPFQRKQWQKRVDRVPSQPVKPGEGRGQPSGYRPDRNRFAPAAKGGPKRGGPPGFPPRREGDASTAGRRFPPRDGRNDRPGQDRFTPAAKGQSPRGGRPSFPPRGERGAPTGERRFPPRGDRGDRPSRDRFTPAAQGPSPRGGRPSFPPRGERGAPTGERRFPPRGKPHPHGERGAGPRGERGTGPDRPFQPGRNRSAPGGFGRSSGQGNRPSDARGGYRGKGPKKFSPGGSRPSGPPSGKFRGKPARPGGPGRPSGPARRGGGPPRPGGKPPNRPPRRTP